MEVSEYKGLGGSDNVGVGPIDASWGGDSRPFEYFNYSHRYEEFRGGVSISALPVAYTRQHSLTWVFD